jgi:hypothetical protein
LRDRAKHSNPSPGERSDILDFHRAADELEIDRCRSPVPKNRFWQDSPCTAPSTGATKRLQLSFCRALIIAPTIRHLLLVDLDALSIHPTHHKSKGGFTNKVQYVEFLSPAAARLPRLSCIVS